MTPYYVYRLRCPITKVVRYIGITNNPKKRLSEHCSNCTDNSKKKQWISQIKSAGMKPIMEVISIALPKCVARSWEVTLHFFYQRMYPNALLSKESIRVVKRQITVASVHLHNPATNFQE